MAAILIVTNAPPEHLRDTAVGVARSLNYDIAPLFDGPQDLAQPVGTSNGQLAQPFGVAATGWSHSARQGNLALSIFFGAFVAYCDFKLNVVFPGDGTSHLILERNKPWWTGAIGLSRVKGRAVDLANAIHNALGQAGFAILDRREI